MVVIAGIAGAIGVSQDKSPGGVRLAGGFSREVGAVQHREKACARYGFTTLRYNSEATLILGVQNLTDKISTKMPRYLDSSICNRTDPNRSEISGAGR